MSPDEERPGQLTEALTDPPPSKSQLIVEGSSDNGTRGALTPADAARLTTKISLRLDTIADNVEAVLPLIEQARVGDAHLALGYRSWTEYVTEKFGGALTRLGRAERLPFVELLSYQGMSTRAIASVVGVSNATVSRDLSGVTSVTPEVVGVDGKTYTRPAPAQVGIPATLEAAVTRLNELDAEITAYTREERLAAAEAIDARLDEVEAAGIRDRWEFGQELLDRRDDNGKLPSGCLTQIVKATGTSRTELVHRMRLAERYPTLDKLSTGIAKFRSWDAFVRGDLKREWSK